MIDRISIGLATSVLIIVWLAWKRHYQWQNLFLTGGGWALFFIVLAVAFEGSSREPAVFLLGCVAGSMIERGFSAEKRRSERVKRDRVVTPAGGPA